MISKKNGPAVNYSKVSAIPPKKSLAYVNNFVINTTQFLNRFSYVCENKLREVSSDITRLEIMLSILESKLASIPGLEGITPETVAQIQNDQPQQQQQQPQQVPPEAPADIVVPTPPQSDNEDDGSDSESFDESEESKQSEDEKRGGGDDSGDDSGQEWDE